MDKVTLHDLVHNFSKYENRIEHERYQSGSLTHILIFKNCGDVYLYIGFCINSKRNYVEAEAKVGVATTYLSMSDDVGKYLLK